MFAPSGKVGFSGSEIQSGNIVLGENLVLLCKPLSSQGEKFPATGQKDSRRIQNRIRSFINASSKIVSRGSRRETLLVLNPRV